MGGALTYLADAAVTTSKIDKPSWNEEKKELEVAACSMQGWRRSMEDAHFMSYNEAMNVYVFGVFDGHGGSGVSRYCARRLPELLFQNRNFQERVFDIALHETFLDLDLETQLPNIQEELYKLHIESKYTSLSEEDKKKVEIHLAFETILDLFLGDPADPLNNPADPFKVFLDEYVMPNPIDIPKPEKTPPTPPGSQPEPPASLSAEEDGSSRRKRRRTAQYEPRMVPRFTAEPHSPWGALASRLRQLLVDEKTNPESFPETSEWIRDFRALLVRASADPPAVPALFRLRSDMDWEDVRIFSDPLSMLFEGKLANLFHILPNQDGSWVYSIHPIDLLALLNNDHLVDSGAGQVRRCVSDDQGCTANVCLLDMGKSGNEPILYCANAGDSRAILVRNGRAVPLSVDHKPSLPGERKRVLHAGGKVLGKADPRVQGDLNLSRAIGDWRHKQNAALPLELQMISPRPDITITEIGKEDEFIVLGCDGVWERFSSADCAVFVHDMSHGDVTSPRRRSFLKHTMPTTETSCEAIAKQICVTTVRKPYEFPGMPVGVTIGCDNMSVIVVRLTSELLDAIPEDKPSPELGATLPVISYGAQVPDDWKPSSGRSSPATPAIPGKRKRGPKPKKNISSNDI